MRCLRIQFPDSELFLLEEAVRRFNACSGYLDDIKIKQYGKHQVLLVPVAESAMFVESYLDDLPIFSKERIKKDLVKGLQVFLDQDPANLPAQQSLKVIKDLSF